MKGSQWDHRSDRDLLLAIIEEGQLKSISWPSIAQKMQAKGYTFTHEACRQHFQKLRKESKTANGDGRNDTSTSTNSTPAKATPLKRNRITKENGAHSSFDTNGNNDDDEELATPSKRKRTAKKEEGGQENGQSARLFKMEDLSGNGNNNYIDLENDDLYEVEY